jgi:hypothetical protein
MLSTSSGTLTPALQFHPNFQFDDSRRERWFFLTCSVCGGEIERLEDGNASLVAGRVAVTHKGQNCDTGATPWYPLEYCFKSPRKGR